MVSCEDYEVYQSWMTFVHFVDHFHRLMRGTSKWKVGKSGRRIMITTKKDDPSWGIHDDDNGDNVTSVENALQATRKICRCRWYDSGIYSRKTIGLTGTITEIVLQGHYSICQF